LFFVPIGTLLLLLVVVVVVVFFIGCFHPMFLAAVSL
jgi:hypothetical protein